MRYDLVHILSAAAIGAALALCASPASAKTAKECRADYAANKDAIKASGQTEKAYIAACRAGGDAAAPGAAAAPAAPAAAPAAAAEPAGGKTAKECAAEYSANKAAIKAVQKKAAFIADCRAGKETIPEAAAPAAAPAPAAAAPAPMAPAPAPAAAAPSAPAPMAPKAGAAVEGGFASDAQAKAKCPSDTVVWMNTKSHIYHFAGTHDYGHTKQGTYMCEMDAKGAGRAAENEKHP
jgi:hypothetical protein